jgi:uncharacterized protein YegP (UPF0339 family)
VSLGSSRFPGDISGQKGREAVVMATATKKSDGSTQVASRAAETHVPASMEFVVFEDNGGIYHWRLVARDGATLGQSGGFGSSGDAEKAAEQVRDGAASASFKRRD